MSHISQHGMRDPMRKVVVLSEGDSRAVSPAGAIERLPDARHERALTMLTSNNGFEEWASVLGDEMVAAALIDRLVHRRHIVNIRGNSYRMPDHQNLLQSGSDRHRKHVP